MPYGAEPSDQCETPLAHPDVWWARVGTRWLPVIAKTWVDARKLFRNFPDAIDEGSIYQASKWKVIMAEAKLIKFVVSIDGADMVYAHFEGPKVKSLVANKNSYTDALTVKHVAAALRRTAEMLEKSRESHVKKQGK